LFTPQGATENMTPDSFHNEILQDAPSAQIRQKDSMEICSNVRVRPNCVKLKVIDLPCTAIEFSLRNGWLEEESLRGLSNSPGGGKKNTFKKE
jgi:hypothetical protein